MGLFQHPLLLTQNQTQELVESNLCACLARQRSALRAATLTCGGALHRLGWVPAPGRLAWAGWADCAVLCLFC